MTPVRITQTAGGGDDSDDDDDDDDDADAGVDDIVTMMSVRTKMTMLL